MSDLVDLVCARYGVTLEQLRSSSRERHVVDARKRVYYLARHRTRMGWRAIARHSTGQDASSARALYQRFLLEAGRDGVLAVELLELERAV